MTFTPRVSLLSTWQKTIQGLNSILGRQQLVTPDDFVFQDFDPTPDWNSMAVSSINIFRAKWCPLGSLALVSLSLTVTFGAPLNNYFTITLPFTIPTGDNGQHGTIHLNNGTTQGVYGFWYVGTGDNKLKIYNSPQGTNFGTGGTFAAANFFLEVQ